MFVRLRLPHASSRQGPAYDRHYGHLLPSEGQYYLTGCYPDPDPLADVTDFDVLHGEFDELIWPALAERVPAFEAIKVVNSWAGHYDFCMLDHNAIVGPHSDVSNFLFANGFSGHGLQQSPAIGRGLSELIIYGGYRALDLSPLGYERVVEIGHSSKKASFEQPARSPISKDSKCPSIVIKQRW